jgi:uncharacterized cupin superfamily protein
MAQTVVRMEPHGPSAIGLTFMGNCQSQNVVAGAPIEIGHNYFVDETERLSAGVWECTACTAEFDAYPVDEFCHILTDEVTITDDEGHPETFAAGDCFVIPRGLRCTWDMPETTRKYYVILEHAPS